MIRAFFIGSCAFISACATTGSGEFSCPDNVEGITCRPASELYNEVDKPGFNLDSQADQRQPRKEQGEIPVNERKPELFSGDVTVAQTDESLLIVNPPAADRTDPVRSAAIKRRVWLAPWIDSDDVWHSQQYIFIDVQGAEWQTGEQGPTVTPLFEPL